MLVLEAEANALLDLAMGNGNQPIVDLLMEAPGVQ